MNEDVAPRLEAGKHDFEASQGRFVLVYVERNKAERFVLEFCCRIREKPDVHHHFCSRASGIHDLSLYGIHICILEPRIFFFLAGLEVIFRKSFEGVEQVHTSTGGQVPQEASHLAPVNADIGNLPMDLLFLNSMKSQGDG